jgi:GT2 family glycosyltransferase/glycosyltransferase involved in cell wall biosynthesis
MLSVILYGRNDSHGYNLHKRAALSLNCIAEVLTHTDDEIIFVDCNTPDDMPTFLEGIHDTLTPKARQLIRTLRLRPALFEQHKRGTHLKVLEPLCRNIAIRRSNPKNRWILSTNTDMVIIARPKNKSLSDVVAETADGFFELPRFEVPETLWETLDRKDPQDIIAKFKRWGQSLQINEVILANPVVLYDGPGDFQLMLRQQIIDINGFDETMVLGWHVDSNLCKRMYLLNGRTDTLLDKLFAYHCDHTRQSTIAHGANRVENSLFKYFENVKSPYLPEQAQTWGLPHEKIEELHLTDEYAGRFAITMGEMLPGMKSAYSEIEFSERTMNHGLYYNNQHVLPYISDYLTLMPPDADIGYFGGNLELLRMLADFRTRYQQSGRILVDKPILILANPTGISAMPPSCVFTDRHQIFERSFAFIFDAAMMGFPSCQNWAGLTVPDSTPEVITYGQQLYGALLAAARQENDRLKNANLIQRKFLLVGATNTWFELAALDLLGTVLTPHSTHVRHGFVREEAFTKPIQVPPIHYLYVTDHPLDQAKWLAQKLNRPVRPEELRAVHMRAGMIFDICRKMKEHVPAILPYLAPQEIDLYFIEFVLQIHEMDGYLEQKPIHQAAYDIVKNYLEKEGKLAGSRIHPKASRVTEAAAGPVLPVIDRNIGINVIWYISGNLGIGVSARHIVRTLIDKGIPIAINDIDPGLGRSRHDMSFEQYYARPENPLPYPINLFIFPPSDLTALVSANQQLVRQPGHLNAVLSMWELPVIPSEWKATMESMDVVVAGTDFLRYTFNNNLSNVQVITAVHPLYMPEGIKADRQRFGLPPEGVLFITSFEPYSDPQRKNPGAVIEAFERGVGSDERAHLIIKLNNVKAGKEMHPLVKQLQERCAVHPRMHILTETMEYKDVMSLYASCDVYVSLHRAEGLGLGLMEAMALAKPVIATAWSGPMTFMNNTNACLVNYALIPVEGSIPAYRRAAQEQAALWADPNVDEAAVWMRRLLDDGALRSQIGRKAQEDMAAHQGAAAQGRFIEELQAIWQHRNASAAATPEVTTNVMQHASIQNAQVDIVIPIYGQPALVRRCVESVLTTTENARLILVDDHTPGVEIQRLMQTWQGQERLTLAETPRNLGFLGTCLSGAKLGDAPYILFLNSDTEAIQPGWLEALIPSEEDIAICGAKLLYPPDTLSISAGKIQHAGVARNDQGIPYHPFLGWPADEPQANQPRSINAVTGACFLVRRSVWEELGGWDATFGRGVYEDVDLCWQARKKGYRVFYQPEAVLYHRSSASEKVGGRHLLYDRKDDNLRKLLAKWQPLSSDEDLFFGAETLKHWQTARREIARAAKMLEQGKGPAATNLMKSVVKNAPDLPEGSIGYAQILSAQGKHAEAADYLTRALKYAPEYWDARLRLVDEWLAAAQPQEAVRELAIIKEAFPLDPAVEERNKRLAAFKIQPGRPTQTVQKPSTPGITSEPGRRRSAEERLATLLEADDLPAALEARRTELDADLLAVVRRNADSARTRGEDELAAGLDNLAEYIVHVIEEETGPSSALPSAQERLAALLEAEDLPAALEAQRAWLDADLLLVVQRDARSARKSGDSDLADGLDNLAEYIKNILSH